MTDDVTRRSMLRGAGVALVGAVGGFALARNSAAAKVKRGTTAANAYGGDPGPSATALASVVDVPVGGGVILPGPAIVLTRPASAEIRAFSSICTHQGCPVDSISNTINCPCHGSRFDLATGAVVSGPASSPLPPIAIRVDGGEVYRA